MVQENQRVYDIARELGLSNKEVLEKLDKIGIKVSSHSSALTPEQVNQFKESLKAPVNDAPKKPKAFIVKKAKPVEVQEPVEESKEQNKKQEPVVMPHPRPRPNQQQLMEQRAQREALYKQIARQKLEKEGILPKKPHTKPQKPAPVKSNKEKKDFQPSQKFVAPRPTKRIDKDGNVVKNESENKQKQEQPVERQPIKRHIIPQEIYNNPQGGKRKVNKSKQKEYKNKEEQQEIISLEKALAQKHKKKVKEEVVKEEVTKVVIDQALTVGDLAEKIDKTPADVVKFLMLQGVLATVNQVIDIATAKKVCANFEIEVMEEDVDAFIEEELKKEEKLKAQQEADAKFLVSRAPVVSIMGHVDHGKTTLLDSIRASKHKIVSTEVGGITQSIGAYTVNLKDKKVVFIDTPGHEAFTEMRARGAKATDIAILVVAADDGIMPQTIEAINHARAAEVPIVVAINKIDKADANPDKIMQQLTEHNLVPEEWGGDTICVKVSAIQGKGLDELLEAVLLLAELKDLKANPQAKASGVVIEANLDKGKGPVATLLVQNGTLKVGDCVVVGNVGGKVRALLNDAGSRVMKAAPSTPVEILGLTEVPQAGDIFEVVENEKTMKQIIQERKESERQTRLEAMMPTYVRNDVVGEDESEIKHLNLIIKANTNGAAEAVSQAVAQMESQEIVVKIVHIGVGDISEADVMLASASNAIILGFSVKEDNNALSAAEKQKVIIKKFDIIYQILEDLEQTMLHLLEPELKEVYLGKAEVRQVFTVGKMNRIAGCYVTEGKILKNKTAKVIRNGNEIYQGLIDQLKRFKDDVKEVAQGFECGISFDKFNDIEVGDIIEVSTTEEVERVSLV